MRCYECDNDPCRCNGDPVLEPEWIKIKDRLPEKHQYVLLLADRYWNTPDGVPDMKVTASGYLAEHGKLYWSVFGLYWSVFGERGFDIDAFTHWMPIPDIDA